MNDEVAPINSPFTNGNDAAADVDGKLSTLRAALSADQREQLAMRLRGGGGQRKSIPFANRSAELRLSFNQERIWLHQELEPASLLLQRPVRFWLKGPIQIEALEGSLFELVRRHETLRTLIRSVGASPQQVIFPAAEMACPVIDLMGAPDVECELEQRIAAEIDRPFALSLETPLRVRLYRLADDEYVLLLLIHHISLDAWSESVLARELAVGYARFVAGQPPAFAPLPIQYADYAAWQRSLPHTAEFQRSVQFWQENLRELPVLELPTDRSKQPLRGEAGGSITFRLNGELTARLKEIARRQDATLFMILLAAWTALLHRCTGQNDLVIGCPVAGRTHPEFEPLIGLFVNPLPLRIAIPEAMTFTELVQECRRVVLTALDHQAVPLQEIIRAAVLPQGRTGSAGFDASFVHERIAETRFDAGDMTFELEPHFEETAGSDLQLELTELSEQIAGNLCYRAELWDRPSMQRMVDRFLVLLESLCSAPHTPVSRLRLLPDEEYRQAVFGWNQTHRDDEQETLAALFERQVNQTPDAAAIWFEGRTVSYAQLNREANRMANWLRSAGVEPDSLVAVCVDRSPAMVAVLLAILKSGAAYLPFDPGDPDERLQLLLSAAEARLLMTEAAHLPRLAASAPRAICLDRDGGLWAESPETNPASMTQPDHLAYMMFTSGSTGKPKGVEIPHRGMVNFLQGMQDCLGDAARQPILAITTASFDISVLELFLPLINGAAMHLIPREIAWDVLRLKDTIDGGPATVLQGTPTMWRMLIEAGWKGNPRFTVLTGGEHLPRDLAHALLERAGSVWNLYGPTEATVYAAAQKIERGFERITIGRPIRNLQGYVLDQYLQPAPIGTTGELCLGGIGLARGYRHRPDLTAEQFVHASLPGLSDTRMYRTGDAARFLNDGIIELLGRRDHQIKWRGHRIEPGEIESAFCAHPSVAAAAVALTGDRPDQQRLTVYLVADLDSVTQQELRELARRKLPEYMMPANYVFLERMPRTSSGKINRRALPRPEMEPALPRSISAPRTPTERLLVDIWREVLGVAEISRDDNFFDLGGHSLFALRVIRRLGTEGRHAPPVALLYRSPVLEDFARAVDDLQHQRTTGPLRMVRPGGPAPPLFLFSGLGGEHHYLRHLIEALELPGPLNVVNWHDDPETAGASSFVELGRICKNAILGAQPHGPYMLAGFSFGGPLAFEVARQLFDGGHAVGLVAILDSGIKRSTQLTLRQRGLIAFRFLQNVPRWLREDFLRNAPSQIWGRVRRKLKQWLRQYAAWSAGPATSRPKQLDELFDADIFPVWMQVRMQADLNLIAAYRPEPAEVRITLFRARVRPLLTNLLDDLGWSRYVRGGIEVIEVSGHHHSMMVPPLATELARELSEAYLQAISVASSQRSGEHRKARASSEK